MYRFTMPSSYLTKEQRIHELNMQFDDYLNSIEAKNIVCLLTGRSPSSLNNWQDFIISYDIRKGQERQRFKTNQDLENILEKNRETLYNLFKELGMISINNPIINNPTHILILGASYNASYNRTLSIQNLINNGTLSTANLVDISALGTYRIIAPIERVDPVFSSTKETEFGVLTDSFSSVFGCTNYSDSFYGGKNTNIISCIRKFNDETDISYNIYAAPSSNPTERANSNDTYNFYFKNNIINSQEKFLLVTNNVYCNYQFIPFAIRILSSDLDIDFDIIGCSNDSNLTLSNEYSPSRYLQDFISIIDWIIKFKNMFSETVK